MWMSSRFPLNFRSAEKGNSSAVVAEIYGSYWQTITDGMTCLVSIRLWWMHVWIQTAMGFLYWAWGYCWLYCTIPSGSLLAYHHWLHHQSLQNRETAQLHSKPEHHTHIPLDHSLISMSTCQRHTVINTGVILYLSSYTLCNAKPT